MALSTGTRTALGEAASWLVAGAIMIASVVYFDELKAAISPLQPASSGQEPQIAPARPLAARPPPRETATRGGGNIVELSAGPYGHYKARAHINGHPIDIMVDTGASYVALTYEDAERAGVFVSEDDFKYKSRTANGYARIAIVDLDRISIDGIEVRNVRASIHQRGALHVTLLGMSFLSKLERAEMRNGRMILED
jgi:aspartyl protease family protein